MSKARNGDVPPAPQPQREITTVQDALRAGKQKYTRIDVPILAIYALPHERGITDPAKRAEADASDLAFQGAMAKAFHKGLPSARVVWLAHADHYIPDYAAPDARSDAEV